MTLRQARIVELLGAFIDRQRLNCDASTSPRGESKVTRRGNNQSKRDVLPLSEVKVRNQEKINQKRTDLAQ